MPAVAVADMYVNNFVGGVNANHSVFKGILIVRGKIPETFPL